jgi:Zn-dependent protease with chaperone function
MVLIRNDIPPSYRGSRLLNGLAIAGQAGLIGTFVVLGITAGLPAIAAGMGAWALGVVAKLAIVRKFGRKVHARHVPYPYVQDQIVAHAMTQSARLRPMWLSEFQMPHVFAASVAQRIILSTPVIDGLAPRQRWAVIAHEIGHTHHKALTSQFWYQQTSSDVLPALACAGAIAASGFALPVVAAGMAAAVAVPFCLKGAFLRQARREEYACDRFAAAAMGSPVPIILALKQLERLQQADAPTGPSLRFRQLMLQQLPIFRTHPTLEQRRRALIKYRRVYKSGAEQNKVYRQHIDEMLPLMQQALGPA